MGRECLWNGKECLWNWKGMFVEWEGMLVEWEGNVCGMGRKFWRLQSNLENVNGISGEHEGMFRDAKEYLGNAKESMECEGMSDNAKKCIGNVKEYLGS